MGQLSQEGRGRKPQHFSGFLRQRFISCSRFTRLWLFSEGLHSWTWDPPLFGSCCFSKEWQRLNVSLSFSLEVTARVQWAEAGHPAQLPEGGDGCCFHRGSASPRAQPSGGGRVNKSLETAPWRRRACSLLCAVSRGSPCSARRGSQPLRREALWLLGPCIPHFPPRPSVLRSVSRWAAAWKLTAPDPPLPLLPFASGPAHCASYVTKFISPNSSSPNSSFLPRQGRWPSRVCTRSPLLDGCAS